MSEYIRKPIIIQGPMETETNYLISKLVDIKEEKIGGYRFYNGKMDGYPVIISKTEIGPVHSGAATALACERYKPLAIINQGTSGGHGKDIHRGDMVIATEAIDMSTFKTISREEGEGSNIDGWELTTFTDEFPEGTGSPRILKSDPKLVELMYSLKDNYKDGQVFKGPIASGSCWNNEIDRMISLNEKYGTLGEEMEMAATYLVAQQFGIPVATARIISNNGCNKEPFLNAASGEKCQKFVEEVTLKYIEMIKEAERTVEGKRTDDSEEQR